MRTRIGILGELVLVMIGFSQVSSAVGFDAAFTANIGLEEISK